MCFGLKRKFDIPTRSYRDVVTGNFLNGLLKQLLCFVDLRGEVRAAASIGMVKEHQLAVVQADFVFGKSSFTRDGISYCTTCLSVFHDRGEEGSSRISGGRTREIG